MGRMHHFSYHWVGQCPPSLSQGQICLVDSFFLITLSFKSQLQLPWGLSRALTIAIVVRTCSSDEHQLSPLESQQHQEKRKRRAMNAHSKEETVSQETQPWGTARLPWAGWHCPDVAAPLLWGTEGALPWPSLGPLSFSSVLPIMSLILRFPAP